MNQTELNTKYESLYKEIEELKKQKNAVILSHFYTRPEVQRAADYLGDSLGLSQQAADTTADIIVFCGVHFMAETASIISPNKKILIPVENAGCTLAESVTGAQLAEWKSKRPNGIVVSYVNTSAEVKAHTDYCVTSANALKVVQSLPNDVPILFGPDKNLGAYINRMTGRNMELWQGDCYVHRHITPDLVLKFIDLYPTADILIHPESVACDDPKVLKHERCHVGSTAGIMKHPAQANTDTFVIATEPETLYELRRIYPDKTFIPIAPEHTCEYMKLTTLEALRDALLHERYEVKVAPETRKKAIVSIERMMNIK